MICGVYALVFPNGREYVGSSVDVGKRHKAHRRAARRGDDYPVYRAWRKYGEPRLDVLELCPEDSRTERETWYLQQLRPAYNLCPVAGHPGKAGGWNALTEDGRRRIVEKARVNTAKMWAERTPEQRKAIGEKISAATRGKTKTPKSPESEAARRRKISESMSRVWADWEEAL